jgi:DNA-directed RNA polymerase specialized sigma24 family protein
MSDPNPSWQFFAALQLEADPKSVDRSLAREEALSAVLNEIITDSGIDSLRKRFDSLNRNRTTKQHNRRAVIKNYFRSTHRRGGKEFGNLLLTVPAHTVFDRLAYEQLTKLISTVLSKEELSLLLDIAEGQRYAEIARHWNMTVSSLKSKAFRIREKLQRSKISAVLKFELQH